MPLSIFWFFVFSIPRAFSLVFISVFEDVPEGLHVAYQNVHVRESFDIVAWGWSGLCKK